MNIVTNFTSTGYTGQFTTTSGAYTLSGSVSTDANKAIKSLAGDITKTADGSKVGSFSLYFNSADSNVQNGIMEALKAVRTALDSDLDL